MLRISSFHKQKQLSADLLQDEATERLYVFQEGSDAKEKGFIHVLPLVAKKWRSGFTYTQAKKQGEVSENWLITDGACTAGTSVPVPIFRRELLTSHEWFPWSSCSRWSASWGGWQGVPARPRNAGPTSRSSPYTRCRRWCDQGSSEERQERAWRRRRRRIFCEKFVTWYFASNTFFSSTCTPAFFDTSCHERKVNFFSFAQEPTLTGATFPPEPSSWHQVVSLRPWGRTEARLGRARLPVGSCGSPAESGPTSKAESWRESPPQGHGYPSAGLQSHPRSAWKRNNSWENQIRHPGEIWDETTTTTQESFGLMDNGRFKGDERVNHGQKWWEKETAHHEQFFTGLWKQANEAPQPKKLDCLQRRKTFKTERRSLEAKEEN